VLVFTWMFEFTPAQGLREALGRGRLPPNVPKEDSESEKQATRSAAGNPACPVITRLVQITELENGGRTHDCLRMRDVGEAI
jgi:hypothetical protein